MKVLFYINVLGGGGAERVIVNLANQFSKKENCESILVASYPIEKEYPVGEAVRRIYLDQSYTPRSFLKRNVYYVKKLRKLIKETSPDTVVAFMAEPNIRLMFATLFMKVRKVISVRNDPAREYNSFASRAIAKTTFSWADTVVFQTADAQKFFSKRIQKKSTIIMNQVHEKFFEESVAETRKDIVTAGRLTEQKNHRLLIDAFAKISDEVPDNLVIYGDGNLKEELENHVKELGLENRISLPGATSSIIDAVKSARVFVLSSDYEGMPNALLEAMALGVPCISTDCPCGGPKALIRDGENGFLVPLKDVDEMAKKIKLLALDEAMQNTFSAEARQTMDAFRPQKILHEWEKAINI